MKINIVVRNKINVLAGLFYAGHGVAKEANYDFSKAKHPHERLMWDLTKLSLNFWENNIPLTED